MVIIEKKFATILACFVGVFLIGCSLVSDPEPLPTLAAVAQIPEIVTTAEPEMSQVADSEVVPSPTSVTNESQLNINGRIALFDRLGGGLYLLNSSGSVEQNQILNLSQDTKFLGTSPDKKLLAFQTPTGLITSAGNNNALINEIPDFSNVSWIIWSANSDRFALISDGDLFVSNLDGTDIHRLTQGLDLENIPGNISWSPDGKYLLFICGPNSSNICIVQSFGEEAVINLTNNDGSTWYREPIWSPNGSRISFISPDDQGNLQIFSMDTTGEEIIQLTEGSSQNSLHTWSADSTYIVYGSVSDNQWQAIVMKADGTQKQVIFQGGDDVTSIYPSWISGDKIGIYFTQASMPDVFAIVVSNLNGTEIVQLTESARWAEWAPDGAQLAFLSSATQLEITSTTSSVPIQVINIQNGSDAFIWLP